MHALIRFLGRAWLVDNLQLQSVLETRWILTSQGASLWWVHQSHIFWCCSRRLLRAQISSRFECCFIILDCGWRKLLNDLRLAAEPISTQVSDTLGTFMSLSSLTLWQGKPCERGGQHLRVCVLPHRRQSSILVTLWDHSRRGVSNFVGTCVLVWEVVSHHLSLWRPDRNALLHVLSSPKVVRFSIVHLKALLLFLLHMLFVILES